MIDTTNAILLINLVISLYLAWKLYIIEEELDELAGWSIMNIINIAKKLGILDETDNDTRR
jgi:hypothetical protein|tara:strand:+ start:198 stop:380 length:183 start_codon:yes stop_codon:yes gene_type:complete